MVPFFLSSVLVFAGAGAATDCEDEVVCAKTVETVSGTRINASNTSFITPIGTTAERTGVARLPILVFEPGDRTNLLYVSRKGAVLGRRGVAALCISK